MLNLQINSCGVLSGNKSLKAFYFLRVFFSLQEIRKQISDCTYLSSIVISSGGQRYKLALKKHRRKGFSVSANIKMAATQDFKLLIHAAKQVVQVVRNRERIVTGNSMKQVAVLEGTENSGYSIVVSR